MAQMNWQALALPFCDLAESPRYAHGRWMWVDIAQRVLYCLNQSDLFNPMLTNLMVLNLPDEIACVLPTANAEVVVALGRQGGWLIEKNQWTLKLAAPFDSKLHRFNDGRADSVGRIWISTLVDARTPDTAALYCIESGKAQLKVSNLIVGNGLAFSPAGKMAFLSDSRLRCIWRFDCDCSTGVLSNQRLIKQYSEGTERPDGACFSADGSYWIAVLDGYRLDRFCVQGELIESISLPLAKPTMPCFGGEAGRTLMVSSMRADAACPNKPGFENVSLIACETSDHGLPEAYANPMHLGGL